MGKISDSSPRQHHSYALSEYLTAPSNFRILYVTYALHAVHLPWSYNAEQDLHGAYDAQLFTERRTGRECRGLL